MSEMIELLSAKRLNKYDSFNIDAVQCHLYNCELAESFYSSLSYFEIILRNKIDKVLSKYLGEDWIFKEKYLIDRNAENMKVACLHMRDTRKETDNKNHIISELNLGFWVYLFSSAYKSTLWDAYPNLINEIFDGSKNKVTSHIVFNKLNTIRMYRNKIFHYGSLIADEYNAPERIHNLIYNIIKEMNAKSLLKQLKSIDNFNEKYKKGRDLNILK